MSEDNVTIEEKYGIVYVNDKRYYQFDMTIKLPILEDTIPYLFRYKTIEVKASAWNKMALGILNALDELNPKTETELLSLTYSWSKQPVFSREKRTNHTRFKNVYLNTNHTATHSMMSIQTILNAYGVDLSECYFLIRRHTAVEPKEAKEYFRQQTIEDFSFSMRAMHIEDERIDKIIGAFKAINKYLAKVSPGYNDFFLFDDYFYFTSYKDKTLSYLEKSVMPDDKKLRVARVCLRYLDEYYANKDFYSWLKTVNISDTFIALINKEIERLLSGFGTDFIVSNKLYSKMMLLYRTEMMALGLDNSVDRLFNLCRIVFRGTYYFKKPYISKNKMREPTNDDLVYQYATSLDSFTISEVNDYIDKMHLKRLDSYLDLMIKCSDSHVQIDVDTMISKTQLHLNASKLESVINDLSFYINSFGAINSETFCGYESLPDIGIKWNKYSLVGVVRSYFGEQFVINYSVKTYKRVAYLITKSM